MEEKAIKIQLCYLIFLLFHVFISFFLFIHSKGHLFTDVLGQQ